MFPRALLLSIFATALVVPYARGSLGSALPAEAVPLAALPVLLVGTLLAEPEQFSAALLVDEEGGVPVPVSFGESVFGRRVISIEADRIGLLGEEGAVEYLIMQEPRAF